jgi:hypothetical protein
LRKADHEPVSVSKNLRTAASKAPPNSTNRCTSTSLWRHEQRALKVLETYRFSTDAKRPRLRLRIEDGMTFTWPREAEASFHCLAGNYIKEDICLDRIARGRPAIDEPR